MFKQLYSITKQIIQHVINKIIAFVCQVTKMQMKGVKGGY